MLSKIQILNPITYSNWDDLLHTHDKSTFFHSTAWARVLRDAYNYRPLYFARVDDGKLIGLLPIMEIDSPLTGKRGVSLPFTDHIPPLAENAAEFNTLFEKAIKHGKLASWKTLEIRGGELFLKGKTPSETYLTHNLNLNKLKEEEIFTTFRSNTRRNIQKALKQGVSAKLLNDLESVRKFYHLNCLTRKDHGLPPQPFSFFKYFFKHVIAAQKGGLVLASTDERQNIAGAVFTSFGSKAIYKYGASEKKYLHLRPNNMVMWEAIKTYLKNGCSTLNFGRTELKHSGLLQFKKGWGTSEKFIHYYRYDLRLNDFKADSPKLKSSYAFFRKMPIILLKFAGMILYKHIG